MYFISVLMYMLRASREASLPTAQSL